MELHCADWCGIGVAAGFQCIVVFHMLTVVDSRKLVRPSLSK